MKKKKAAKKQARSAGVFDREVGNRIRLARNAIGLSQEALARPLHVSFQQVQKYEKGTNRISSAGLLEIAKQLHTDPNTLLGWNEKPIEGTQTPISADSMRLSILIDRLDSDHRAAVLAMVRTLITQGHVKKES